MRWCQIASLTIVYSTVYSGADQRKHQSSASLAFLRGIHRWPVNSSHKRSVTRKIFPFDDVIMACRVYGHIHALFGLNSLHFKSQVDYDILIKPFWIICTKYIYYISWIWEILWYLRSLTYNIVGIGWHITWSRITLLMSPVVTCSNITRCNITHDDDSIVLMVVIVFTYIQTCSLVNDFRLHNNFWERFKHKVSRAWKQCIWLIIKVK